MNEFIELLKKLWGNKRTRSIAILLLYVLFFIIVFMLLNSSSSQPQYRFLPNSTIDKVEASINNADISVFSISNLRKILENATLESTNYVDKYNIYLIFGNDYNRIVNYDAKVNCNVRIKLYNDNSKVVIDLNECYGYLVNIDLRS